MTDQKAGSNPDLVSDVSVKKHVESGLVVKDTINDLIARFKPNNANEEHISWLDPELLSNLLRYGHGYGVARAYARLLNGSYGVYALLRHHKSTVCNEARVVKNTTSTISGNSTTFICDGADSTMMVMNTLDLTRAVSVARPSIDIEAAFNDLIEVTLSKGTLYVKARDLALYCGIEDHGRITRLGSLLALLARLGLAVKHNRRRPTRYSLIPQDMWWMFIDICGFLEHGQRYRCTTDGSVCGLAGICPYWKVRQYLHKKG